MQTSFLETFLKERTLSYLNEHPISYKTYSFDLSNRSEEFFLPRINCQYQKTIQSHIRVLFYHHLRDLNELEQILRDHSKDHILLVTLLPWTTHKRYHQFEKKWTVALDLFDDMGALNSVIIHQKAHFQYHTRENYQIDQEFFDDKVDPQVTFPIDKTATIVFAHARGFSNTHSIRSSIKSSSV